MDTFTLQSAIISAIVISILTALYWKIRKSYNYFTKRNIPGPIPGFPLGTWNFYARLFVGEEDVKNIEKYGSVVGTFDGLTPNLLTTDNEHIERILRGDNSKFRSRRVRKAKNVTLKRVLQILDEGQPKEMAAQMNILNKRISKVIPTVESAAKLLARGLIEAKENSLVVANDVIAEFVETVTATAVLGLDLNEDPIFRQRFVKQSKSLLAGTSTTSALAAISYLYGGSDNSTFSSAALEYFKEIAAVRLNKTANTAQTDERINQSVIEIITAIAAEEKKVAMKEKAQENEVGETLDDCLLMTDALATDLILATIVTLLHHAKSTLIFGLHALATNQAVQRRLTLEVKTMLCAEKQAETPGLLYEKMPYMNAFIKEVHRKYPTEFRIEKIATEDTSLSEVLELTNSAVISIPIYALHTSKLFHTDAEIFSPERFLSDNYEKQHHLFNIPQGYSFLSYFSDLITKIAFFKIADSLKIGKGEMTDEEIYLHGLTGLPTPSSLQLSADLQE